jgi:hypothetical protein
MSFSSVRPFFRTNLDELGFSEWKDGFNFENIPDQILNNSYHIEVGQISGGPSNQLVHEFSYPVLVRIFLKGYLDPASGIDAAMEVVDNVYHQVLDPSVRLGTVIKDVIPDSVSVRPQDISNDNNIVLELGFSAILICNFQ